jgi:hypothetical protein
MGGLPFSFLYHFSLYHLSFLFHLQFLPLSSFYNSSLSQSLTLAHANFLTLSFLYHFPGTPSSSFVGSLKQVESKFDIAFRVILHHTFCSDLSCVIPFICIVALPCNGLPYLAIRITS